MGRSRRPNGAPRNPVRSVRVDDPTWDRAVRRATYEGTTMSAVLLLFVRGYAGGQVNAPRVQVVYTDTSRGEPAAAKGGESEPR